MSAPLASPGRGFPRRAWGLFAVLTLLCACASDRRPPPAAPVLEAPADAIPPELDWVLRFDLGRLRSALGTPAVERIRSTLDDGDPVNRLGLDVLARANVCVVAMRFEGRGGGDIVDAVIAAEGDFRNLDPRAYAIVPPWQPPVDLGRDVRRYDRGKPKKRSDPARLYLYSNRMVVVVSEAAVDSVEAVIEKGAPPNPVRPPERGIVSAAVRLGRGELPLGDASRFPTIAGALEISQSLEMWVDQTAAGFGAQVAFEFASDSDAARAAEVLERARGALGDHGGWAGTLARHAKVRAEGRHLFVDVEVPLALVAKAIEGGLP